MYWVRVGVLISLLLVAMTLPVSARSSALPNDDSSPDSPTSEHHTPDAPKSALSSSMEPADTNPTDADESSSRLQIAPNTDFWHAGLTRTAAAETGPVLIQSLLGYDVGVPLMADDIDPKRPLDSPRPNEGAQQLWLACRYAHAPPVTIQT